MSAVYRPKSLGPTLVQFVVAWCLNRVWPTQWSVHAEPQYIALKRHAAEKRDSNRMIEHAERGLR